MTTFHDHHIHLLATAAARQSVDVSGDLVTALRDADASLPSDTWIRAVGYHESVAGEIDRAVLDTVVPNRPVRVQHRTGARWTLNSAAITSVGIDSPTGHIHRGDQWLRQLLPRVDPPDLAALGTELTAYGVTAVTDTTPYTDLADLAPIADAVASGALPQRVIVTGGPELAGCDPPPGLEWGPVKVVIDDADYPSLDDLTKQFEHAHHHGRPVAVHCVTRTSLALVIAAWDAVSAMPGDRVEHASVVSPDLRDALVRHEITVVTQPGFVAERGDDYLRDVDADDLPYLYPLRSLLDAGITVRLSTDAPYTDPDPWKAIEAAVERRTNSGAVLGPDERIDRDTAIALFS